MFQASVVRCARLRFEENNNPQQQWKRLKSKEKRM